jgi:cell division protein FtsZ
MSDMFQLMDNCPQSAIIKVIGVGGGGGNAIEHMVAADIEGVEFICANTDAQALRNSSARTVLQLGTDVTKGLGAGANPEVGRQAALEDTDRIRDVLQGADMVFITAGMGGGTGTGGAPVVAEVAKELGALTVAVVTRPFPFEGRKRLLVAEEGIRQLSQRVDSLITIPNEKLLTVLGKGVTLLDAFRAANNVLLGAVQGIAELITRPGLINVDFADVRTVMSEMGVAMMGTGTARGENRARVAADAAIASPLLDDIDLAGAKGVLVNVTAGMDLSIAEFEEVGDAIKSFTSDNATVIVGTVIDPQMTDELRVTLVATGLSNTANQSSGSSWAEEKDRSDRDSLRMQRHSGLKRSMTPNRVKESASEELDYLDIPAFLRRQAD